MKATYISILLLFITLSINLYASDLSQCKGSPLEVDSKNDTSKELRKSWTNCSATVTRTDGNKYVGEFKDGKLNGQGTYTYPNGDKYVGEWNDNKRHGQGIYTFANGNKYVGEWKDNKYHGQGTYTFADGGKYVGEYKDSKYHGQGTQTFTDGNKYVGEYKDSKYHGQGTYTFADGGKYVGEWKDSQRNGQGIHIYANGNIYDGGWQGDKWYGKGVLYEKDQYRVVVSEFINNATHPTKSNFSFKVSESDIFLRCLYKGEQGYKSKDAKSHYRDVGGMEILLQEYKLKTEGYMQSFSLTFKKEYSLIGEPDKSGMYIRQTHSKNYISDKTRMDVLRNQLECDDYCTSRYISGNANNDFIRKNERESENIVFSEILHNNKLKYYKKHSDPTKKLSLKIKGREFGLNRKNLQLHDYGKNDYYQCTMEPVVEFWMFAGKMINKNKEQEEDIERQKQEEASKNKI